MEMKLIDNAYDLARTKFAKKAFTFTQLWKELIKKAKLDAEDQKQVGHVYTSMLQDHRFIFIGNDEWKIREFLTLEQQEELSNALYDFAKDNEPASKSNEDDYTPSFDSDEDEEYNDNREAAALEDEDEEEEIDNESESSDDEQEDEPEKTNEEDE